MKPSEPESLRSQLERSPNVFGWILREAGDYAGAVAHHQEGIARAQSSEARFLELFFAIELSLDLLALGDDAAAGTALARARALFDAGARPEHPCYARRTQQRLLAARARLALACEDRSAAGEAARALLELAALHPSHEHLIEAHELLARLALAERDPARASASVQAALLLLEQFPSALLGWRLHALGAEVHARLGAREPARACAEQARGLIERLGADLRAVALEQTFLDSAPVRAARSLSP